MTAPQPAQLQIPSGLVCCTTYGPIRHETASCLMEMRSFSEKNGINNVQYTMMPGTLVEKARNEAVRMLLRSQCGWLLFMDGDMVWQPNALQHILVSAYGYTPHADMMGAYCTLRGESALPTIDTGTGTWESHFPGSDTLEVIRTGAAFVLTKRHVYEALKDPWYRMRVPSRPIDFMAEVDNFARIKFDGVNRLRGLAGEPWERLEKCALDDPSVVSEQFVPTEVGEDSGFCDRARHAGFRIFVDTNIVVGHVDTKITDWRDHKKAMEQNVKANLWAIGIWA